MITDKLGTHAVACRQILPGVEASIAQVFEQLRRKLPCPITQARENDAGIPIVAIAATFRQRVLGSPNLFVPSRRSAIAIHLHRLMTMAEWKSVTVAAGNRPV
ncbi:hypothetical protein [Methylosinus sporium]|uniref:hypothetical protein n=1 Tax=Methylosinus sporium TaxID=428 RepID=UPI00383A3BE8